MKTIWTWMKSLMSPQMTAPMTAPQPVKTESLEKEPTTTSVSPQSLPDSKLKPAPVKTAAKSAKVAAKRKRSSTKKAAAAPSATGEPSA